MRILKIALAVAVPLLLLGATSGPADAGHRGHFSFGYYGPGVSFHIGPRYRSWGSYYSPYYYRPYSYGPRVYRRSGGRCSHWSRRCGSNWGYRNSNYYGCMRYHGCR